MASTNFSVGRDCQLVVMGPYGRVDLTFVTAFDSKQLTKSVRVACIDGTPLGAELPVGWEGEFEVERGSSAVDDFIAAIEASYFTGKSVPTATLYQYISEANGGTSTYQYEGVVFKLAEAGTWKGDSGVTQKLAFFASKRTRV